ncbi:MAG: hypothetical protein E5W20_04595 [Mesorhizobium sp.]|nr:MAG: hypothetical protein E5W20_04595 [Mesorhizobium sp.]
MPAVGGEDGRCRNEGPRASKGGVEGCFEAAHVALLLRDWRALEDRVAGRDAPASLCRSAPTCQAPCQV